MFTLRALDVLVLGLLGLRRLGVIRRTLWVCGLLVGAWVLQPPTYCGCVRLPLQKCDYSLRYRAALGSDLKNLASQEEIYFSDTGLYTVDWEALGFYTSYDVTMTIYASPTGWSAWATHAALEEGKGCGLTGGIDAPLADGRLEGRQPGELFCDLG